MGWRDPAMQLAGCATTCDTRNMKALDQARATIAGADARRVAVHPITGKILVAPTSTHLLARRAEGGVWA